MFSGTDWLTEQQICAPLSSVPPLCASSLSPPHHLTSSSADSLSCSAPFLSYLLSLTCQAAAFPLHFSVCFTHPLSTAQPASFSSAISLPCFVSTSYPFSILFSLRSLYPLSCLSCLSSLSALCPVCSLSILGQPAARGSLSSPRVSARQARTCAPSSHWLASAEQAHSGFSSLPNGSCRTPRCLAGVPQLGRRICMRRARQVTRRMTGEA